MGCTRPVVPPTLTVVRGLGRAFLCLSVCHFIDQKGNEFCRSVWVSAPRAAAAYRATSLSGMAFAMPSMKFDAAGMEMLTWIVCYCIASSSMTILNKAAINAFNYPFWLCTLQNLATLLVLALIVAVAPKGHKIFGLRVQYSNKVALTWTPAAILFCTMLVSAMCAMQTMSVTTVLVTRSLTPLVTLILEARVLGAPAAAELACAFTQCHPEAHDI